MNYLDSMSRPIDVGDLVRFRGQDYIIAEFLPGRGRFGTAAIRFTEEQHTPELADEVSVDLIAPKTVEESSQHITVWSDQTEKGNDLVQPTESHQPTYSHEKPESEQNNGNG